MRRGSPRLPTVFLDDCSGLCGATCLAYRCGGSVGIAPTSRFTSCVRITHKAPFEPSGTLPELLWQGQVQTRGLGAARQR